MPGRTLFERSPGGAVVADPSPPSGLVTVDGKTFPLKSAWIRGRAEGGVAESRLVQSYTNPHEEPLEVLYTLPLPADGAVVGYTITLGERVITGEVEPIEQARESYRRALEEGRTAGLLEQDRADTFTQSLGSLPAGATAEIEIRILHPLAYRPGTTAGDACWEYRFPTVVGVRYHGGGSRVPDAERLDVDRADASGTPVQVGLDLVLADGDPDRLQASSSSHDILTESDQAGTLLRLDETARLDRDVVIRWRAAEGRVGLRLVEGPGLPGDDGRYGLLTITPPRQAEATFHRDLTILMDASGSMAGWPMECSKRLVEQLLDSLEPEDRFELLAFSTSVEALTRGTVKATGRKVKQARQRLASLSAGGCTEMAQALEEALRPLRLDAQRQVILLTDGYIGFESEVIGGVLSGLEPGCRVHAVGVGSAPNRTLTRGVARAGRGAELFIEDTEGVGAAAASLLKATVGPVLTDLSVDGAACRQVAPSRAHDVLAGQPVVLAVDLRADGGLVEVRGRTAGAGEPWVRELHVPSSGEGNGESPIGRSTLPLGALFGREAVEDLELHRAICDEFESGGVDSEIEQLGLHHRITTRRTSLVAVADEPSVDPREPRRRRKLEVELPAGISAEGVGLTGRFESAPAGRSTLFSIGGVMDECFAAPKFARDSAPRRMRRGVGGPAPGASHRMVQGRVLRCEGGLLVIELESPHDGFTLPRDDAPLHAQVDDLILQARIVEERSSHPGPHGPGLTLKLALQLEDSENWPPGARVQLPWNSGDETWTVIVELTE